MSAVAEILELLEKESGEPVTNMGLVLKDIGLDSLDLVNLSNQLEDQFHISIPTEDLPELATGTVSNLVAYVLSKQP